MIVSMEVEDDGWNAVAGLPDLAQRALAAAAAACGLGDDVEVAVLFAGDDAVAELNGRWRGKPMATNVLSFPAEDFPLPPGEPRPLGDIVLAAGVVAREAAAQGKTLPQHASHLMIHGLLHLAGHDHQDEAEAVAMEGLETQIMKGLGFPDPYDRQ